MLTIRMPDDREAKLRRRRWQALGYLIAGLIIITSMWFAPAANGGSCHSQWKPGGCGLCSAWTGKSELRETGCHWKGYVKMTDDRPRKRPCSSCPYRQDVPSGVWSVQEYRKLEIYDGETGEQAAKGAVSVFACHQGDGQICAGWAHVHGDEDNLALRFARSLDSAVDVDAVLQYSTDVSLWRSGAEAAAHGIRDISAPGAEASKMIRKITTVRALRGSPVNYGNGEA